MTTYHLDFNAHHNDQSHGTWISWKIRATAVRDGAHCEWIVADDFIECLWDSGHMVSIRCAIQKALSGLEQVVDCQPIY
jgi:hypothetical protein